MVLDLEGVAKEVNKYDDFQHPDVIKILKYTNDISNFGFIGVADSNGDGYDSQGNIVNISNREYFKDAMKGQVSFSEMMESKVFKDRMVQIIAHPIRSEGNVIRGVVFGVLHVDDIEELGVHSEKNIQDSIYIVDSCGSYIAQFRENHIIVSSDNFWSDLEKSSLSDEELSRIKSDFEERREGEISYFYNENERYACYMPLGPNKWQLIYSVSTSNKDDIVHKLYWLDTKEVVFSSICYVILLMCIVGYFKRTHAETRKAHQEATKNLEYMHIATDHLKHIIFEYDQTNRIIRLINNVRNQLFVRSMTMMTPENLISRNVIVSDSVPAFKKLFEDIKTMRKSEVDIEIFHEGKKFWYRVSLNNVYDDKNRIIDTVGVVEDVSVQKKREEEMKKRLQVQKTLISKALVYGVVDLHTATILEWNEEEVNLPYEETIHKKILNEVVEEYVFYVKQKLSLKNLRNKYQQGKESGEVQCLMKFGDEVRWVSVVIYRMYMDDTSKILFTLKDIDNQKRRELFFKNRAERDGLTGLYNAITTRSKIDEVLSLEHQVSENQIFVLIDLDNYKQINDTFGHSYGDQVLVDVANILNKKFRSSDIVGRIGGDEFVILLRDIQSYEYAERIIDDLCKSICKTYKEENREVSISASIGIATAPKDGDSFQELYEKSDIAQYQVKMDRKNGFKWYE